MIQPLFDSLKNFWELWVAVLMVGSFLLSLIGVGAVIVLLPADAFCKRHQSPWWGERHPVVRWCLRIGKNVVGVLLVLMGVALSLPGVPGQGLLTIAIGLVFLEFPGKHRLARWLLSRRRIHSRIDRLRGRFGRPPLILDDRPRAE